MKNRRQRRKIVRLAINNYPLAPLPPAIAVGDNVIVRQSHGLIHSGSKGTVRNIYVEHGVGVAIITTNRMSRRDDGQKVRIKIKAMVADLLLDPRAPRPVDLPEHKSVYQTVWG